MKSFLKILLVSIILKSVKKKKLIFKQSEKRWTKHRRSVDLPQQTKKEDAQPCNVKKICLGHSDQTNKYENAKLSHKQSGLAGLCLLFMNQMSWPVNWPNIFIKIHFISSLLPLENYVIMKFLSLVVTDNLWVLQVTCSIKSNTIFLNSFKLIEYFRFRIMYSDIIWKN